MKTRIKIELPDYAGDVKVRAQIKANFFSSWTDIATGWALSYGDLPEAIDRKVEAMKRAIDAYLAQPRTITYPEEQ